MGEVVIEISNDGKKIKTDGFFQDESCKAISKLLEKLGKTETKYKMEAQIPEQNEMKVTL